MLVKILCLGLSYLYNVLLRYLSLGIKSLRDNESSSKIILGLLPHGVAQSAETRSRETEVTSSNLSFPPPPLSPLGQLLIKIY
jgi:hypothetical protein